MGRPKIKDTKTRFNLLLPKTHKEHLEKQAELLGISLNSLFVMSAMEKYPYKTDK